MNKKEIIIIIIIVFCTLFLASQIYFDNKKQEKPKEKIEEHEIICNKIKKSEESKENFVIVVRSKSNMNGDINDAINEFKNKYNNISIYEIEVEDLNKKCMKIHFEPTGYYEELIKNKITTIMGYKSGIIEGVIQNPTSLREVEEYFEQINIIKVPKIKEKSLTYDKYKENIEEYDDYIISIITTEEARTYTMENTTKMFPNIKHDIINLSSDEGNKIYKDIMTKVEIEQIYPHSFYFKNGNIIANHTGGFTSELEEFRILVEDWLKQNQ